MFSVYKYLLQIVDDQEITLQGKPLSIINQNGDLCLYALYNAKETPKKYAVHISGTGHIISNKIIDDYTFLGTITFYLGSLVFHIFYKELNSND